MFIWSDMISLSLLIFSGGSSFLIMGEGGGRFSGFATELTSTYLVYNYFLHNLRP